MFNIGERVKHTETEEEFTVSEIEGNKITVTREDGSTEKFVQKAGNRVFLESADDKDTPINELEKTGIDISNLEGLDEHKIRELIDRIGKLSKPDKLKDRVEAGEENNTPVRKIILEGIQLDIDEFEGGEELWNFLMDIYTFVGSGTDLLRGGGRKKAGVEQEKTINSNWKPVLALLFKHTDSFKAKAEELGYLDA